MVSPRALAFGPLTEIIESEFTKSLGRADGAARQTQFREGGGADRGSYRARVFEP